jgi:hypothetical protein
MHPLARAARVLGARLVELERELRRLANPYSTPVWTEYKEVARLLAEVEQAQKAEVPALVVRGGEVVRQPIRSTRARSRHASSEGGAEPGLEASDR